MTFLRNRDHRSREIRDQIFIFPIGNALAIFHIVISLRVYIRLTLNLTHIVSVERGIHTTIFLVIRVRDPE